MRSGTRVVVTGLGTVSAAGTDLDAFWTWVCGADPAPVSTPVAGFDPRDFMGAKAVRRSDPFARYGVAAASGAMWSTATGHPLRSSTATPVAATIATPIPEHMSANRPHPSAAKSRRPNGPS